MDFVAAIQVYMIPSDLNLHIGTIQDYNNKILVSLPNFSIGFNKAVNTLDIKPRKEPEHKEPKIPDKNKASKTSAKEHEEEKQALIIFGVGIIILSLWFFK